MIKINEFKEVQRYLAEINSMATADIEIEGIEIPEKILEEWRFIGLNNRAFVDEVIALHERGDKIEIVWDVQ